MRKPTLPGASFENIQAFLDNSRGQITIGEIPPTRGAALAAVGKKARRARNAATKKPCQSCYCVSTQFSARQSLTTSRSTKCTRKSSGADLRNTPRPDVNGPCSRRYGESREGG